MACMGFSSDIKLYSKNRLPWKRMGFSVFLSVSFLFVFLLFVVGCEPALDGKSAQLVERMKNGGEYERKDAALLLAEDRDLRTVPYLIKALKDPSVLVRTAAAGTLGEMRDGRAIEPLIACMDSDNRELRMTCANSLGKMDRTVIQPLIDNLGSSKVNLRRGSAYALTFIYSEDVVFEPLKKSLKDTDAEVRYWSCLAIANTGREEVFSLLVEVLQKDKNGGVRSASALALGTIKNGEAVPYLIQALETDSYTPVKENSANSLGLLGDSRAVPALRQALADPDQEVQKKAMVALGYVGSEEDIQYIKPLLNHPVPQVREVAKDTIEILEGK